MGVGPHHLVTDPPPPLPPSSDSTHLETFAVPGSTSFIHPKITMPHDERHLCPPLPEANRSVLEQHTWPYTGGTRP